MRSVLTIAACLLLTACISDPDENPFDESGFSEIGAKEPFSSTVYPTPGILTQDSPSTYQQAEYQGQAQRLVFDRRSAEYATIDAYLFSIVFEDDHTLTAIVNAEFNSEANASAEAVRFGRYIGQLPAVLRSGIDELWVHKGRELWGSVDNALYVHTDMTADYSDAGILEETLVHEAVHVALDEDHENSPDWEAAQTSDDNFISTYAKENAATEDLAESFVMWMASRYMAETLTADNLKLVEQVIPARLSYFNQQNFDMSPVGP